MLNIKKPGSRPASDTEVRQAAREFAAALLAAPQFQAYDAAGDRLNEDAAAQKAIQAFQQKQQEFQERSPEGIPDSERAQLEALRSVFMVMPVVIEYLNAQAEAVKVAQEAGDLLSAKIGMAFATSACSGGCCG
jgi:cell fate (sporulation/competence/biofilm development) regulator YlbF (YheA/YmcA/DUF963 family)